MKNVSVDHNLDSVIFIFLSMIRDVCAIHHQSSYIIRLRSTEFSFVFLCWMCVTQDKSSCYFFYLRPSIDFWRKKKFPTSYLFVFLSFIRYFKTGRNDYATSRNVRFFFYVRLKQPPFCGQWKCATFSFFSLLKKKTKKNCITQDPIEAGAFSPLVVVSLRNG